MGYGAAEAIKAALECASTEHVRELLRTYLSSASLPAPDETPKLAGKPIPKVIHQIWIGPRPPPQEWIDTWRVQHCAAFPSWQHRLWRDADIEEILPAAVRRAFKLLSQWCLKADIARYAILEKHGGVYIDADTAWLGRDGLDAVTANRSVVLALERCPSEGFGVDERIGNGVIGIHAAHELMSAMLNSIAQDFTSIVNFLGSDSPFLNDFRIGYRITSPAALTHMYKALGMKMADLVPSSVFYPLPWFRGQSLSTNLEETRSSCPSAIATHYGYSTNRLGGDSPSVASTDSKRAYEKMHLDGEPQAVAARDPTLAQGTERGYNFNSDVDLNEFVRSTMDERRMLRWESCMMEARSAQKDALLRCETLEPRVCRLLHSDAFQSLCCRTVMRFDLARHPLREFLLEALGEKELQLNLWHEQLEHFSPDDPARILQQKFALLKPLRDNHQRAAFETAYNEFVCDVIAPSVAETMRLGGTVIRKLQYAAFPCIRMLPPSANWCIRPHLDSTYGHPPGSVNIWMPLTDAVASNTLFAESSPGQGDFAPMELKYGEFCRWYGTHCIHFGLPNATRSTRVSLDFRVVPEPFLADSEGKDGKVFALGDYYSLCEENADGQWKRVVSGRVSEQHGFPFQIPNIKYK